MSKSKQLVPKLRFPEFVDSKEWDIYKLSLLAERITKKNKDVDIHRVLTNSAVHGILDQRDYFDKDIANKSNLEGYLIVDKDDYVYNPRVSSIAPVGPVSKNKVGKGVMSPLYTIFRFKNNNNDFYEQYFKSSKWHRYLQVISNTGARHDRMSITNNEFMMMPIPVPKLKEQTKIAACLSSLDELITAHTEKLEALKKYKKGLMQQLFPEEGEIAPKLRFSEFRDEGEWESKKVSELLLQSFYGTSKSTSDIGKYPVLRMGNMYDGKIDISNLVYIDLDENEFSKLQLKKDDILLNRTNSFDLVGKVSIFNLGMECVVASYIVVYRFDNSQIIPQFCNFLLNTYLYQEKIKMLSTKAVNQANINPTTFKESIFISYPSLKEQTKIADCLSSLDELITAQNQKLEALKTHKKGLMQQLFPAVD